MQPCSEIIVFRVEWTVCKEVYLGGGKDPQTEPPSAELYRAGVASHQKRVPSEDRAHAMWEGGSVIRIVTYKGHCGCGERTHLSREDEMGRTVRWLQRSQQGF
jgi:hypothetical protein